MWTSPPVTVTGTAFTVANPSKPQNSQPAVAVQVANASPWIVTCQAGGQQVTIQPFVAATIPVALSNDLGITPALLAYTQLPPGYVQAVWLQAKEQPPQPDGPLTAAATIAASLGVADTLLSPSPFTFPANTVGTGKAFSIPAGSPSFSNLLIGFENVAGSTASSVIIAVIGRDSGILYLDTATLNVGQYITCLFSSAADPSGVFVQLGGLVANAAVLTVVGQVNPSVFRQYRAGPTNYQSGSASGTALIPATGVAGSIVRIWSAWVSVEHPTAFCDGTIQLQPAGNPLIINAQTPTGGGAGANNITFPGGLPFRLLLGTNHIDVTCSAGGSVRGGLAWSVDI